MQSSKPVDLMKTKRLIKSITISTLPQFYIIQILTVYISIIMNISVYKYYVFYDEIIKIVSSTVIRHVSWSLIDVEDIMMYKKSSTRRHFLYRRILIKCC